MTCARFAATKLLPSLGSELVTRTFFKDCFSRIWYRRERRVRNSSIPYPCSSELKNNMVFESGDQQAWAQRASSASKVNGEANDGIPDTAAGMGSIAGPTG